MGHGHTAHALLCHQYCNYGNLLEAIGGGKVGDINPRQSVARTQVTGMLHMHCSVVNTVTVATYAFAVECIEVIEHPLLNIYTCI